MNNLDATNSNFEQIEVTKWTKHLNRDVVKRTLIMTILVGSFLTLTNQSSAIFAGDKFNLVRVSLAYATPFFVVLLAQLSAISQFKKTSDLGERTHNSSFISTMFSNGIPFRALMFSAIAGSINGSFILLETFKVTGSIEVAPLIPIAQAFMLPLIIGLVVQNITYRKTSKQWQ